MLVSDILLIAKGTTKANIITAIIAIGIAIYKEVSFSSVSPTSLI